ncbi:DEAD-domain-containing protein [Ceraceosorus guamensis]|uniref:ATP-dependent RNA helicase n=1 Tax=Ceraceosorus guamensis TaxID=1522189 RepID=A0A316VMT6_9BASI|nr:DEAD-domain-containing protein [Ceraceosorus guamensis]PWN38876.1 DEAD-domain-containing protein [Ceraceosorus guamensis]
MQAQLQGLGIKEWFAVQTAVIPLLLNHPDAHSLYPAASTSRLDARTLPRDLCVTAPTGSGKTLAYCVPILEVLRRRRIPALRALIILPTRELVNQVRETFEVLLRAYATSKSASMEATTGGDSAWRNTMPLRIASVTGSKSFASEAASLARSEVDILLATPGRLVDHLLGARGQDAGDVEEDSIGSPRNRAGLSAAAISLQQLRFLVIDEADRLLGQSFQNWASRLLAALSLSVDERRAAAPDEAILAPAWLRQQAVSQGATLGRQVEVEQAKGPGKCHAQKLLFSATLTRDPAKMAALDLHDPHYITVRAKPREGAKDGQDGSRDFVVDIKDDFELPAGLKEHLLVVPTSLKPLYLLHLLYSPAPATASSNLESALPLPLGGGILIFTKSVESSTRLVKLMQLFVQEHAGRNAQRTPHARHITVAECSSELSSGERRRILSLFKKGHIDVLVSSDLIARGIDLPSVAHVVSYDVPVDMAKYVHRVGRTARANNQGHAWSLVEEPEARYFKQMMARSGRLDKLRRIKLQDHVLQPLRPAYDEALGGLARLYTKQ